MSTISEYMRDPEVSKVQMLCDKPERYAVRYEDGSAMLVDGDGNMIKSPLGQFDVVSKVSSSAGLTECRTLPSKDATGPRGTCRKPGCSMPMDTRSFSGIREAPASRAWITSNGNSRSSKRCRMTPGIPAGLTPFWWISILRNKI